MGADSNATSIIGGLPPPPGVTPNFVNPESLHSEWVLMMSMCLAFTTIFVGLRLYTKLVIIKSHGWEDYTSFIAWVTLPSISSLLAMERGFISGTYQLSKSESMRRQAVNAKEVANGPVIYVVKLSILLQFRRIFVPSRMGTAYYVIQSVNGLNLLFYTAYTFASTFHCIPRRKIWEPHTPGHCLDIARLIISSALINVVSDLAMFMIPLFCISSLHMPLKKKLGVSIVFATGVFACLTSILRTEASFRIVGKHDQTYELIPLAFWSDAEMASGIICGCMPVMPQFFRHFVPKIKSHFSTDNRSKTESASRSTPFAANPVAPWGEHDEFHNLKGKHFSIDLQSLDQTSNAPQDGINLHAKEMIGLLPPPRERSGEWFESTV
ncbi:hypothetical protein MMC29_001992 [Sticta canariensis]|nr:hypothetical protein [Sticta canariensis]